jgi:sugar lactone lactonase YvrE
MAQRTKSGTPGPAGRAWRRLAVAATVALLVAAAVLAGAGTALAKPAGPVLAFTPSPYDYGRVTPGERVSQRFRLTNSGGKATGKLKVTLAGAAAFSLTGDRCSGTKLRPGKSCGVRVRFAPTGAATVTATLTAADNKGRVSATVALSGAGTGLGVPPGNTPLGNIYWANAGDGTINQANLDGTDAHAIVTGQTSPVGVAADVTNLYWTSSAGGGEIWRADLEGKNAQAIVTGQANPSGLAVDPDHLFWANNGDGTIWRANLDGSSRTAIVTNQAQMGGVAVDANFLYWTTTLPNGDGFINRANLADGSGAQAIVDNQQLPLGVAVDPDHLYWANNSGTIMQADLDGNNPTTLVTAGGAPLGLAVDARSLYWTDPVAQTINQANLDGTGQPRAIVTGQSSPSFMAVTLPVSDHLYWANSGDGTIWRANPDGSGATAIVSGQTSAEGVAVDARHLYWTSNAGISRARLDGTNAQTILPGVDAYALAVDASHLYWIDIAQGSVRRANLDGTSPQTIVPDQGLASGLAVDASHLYWTDHFDGTIIRANLDGTGQPQTLFTGQNGPAGVAVDAAYLYWASDGDGTIKRANLDGTGQPQTLVTTATPAQNPVAVAVDASHLYWATQDEETTPDQLGAIWRANLDNPQASAQAIVTGQSAPRFMAISPSAAPVPAHVYWTNNADDTLGPRGTVNAIPIVDANPSVRVLASGQAGPTTGVAVDANHVYWAAGTTIGVVNLDGTGGQAHDTGAAPQGVAVDASHVYWADNANHVIWRANLDLSSRQVLVGDQALMGGVAVDAHFLYWTTQLPGGAGFVNRANLADGSGAKAIGNARNPWGVAVDPVGDQLYWTDAGDDDADGDGTIVRANLDGTGADAVVDGQNNPVGVAVDPVRGQLYWTDVPDGTINRASLDGTDLLQGLIRGQDSPWGVAVGP